MFFNLFLCFFVVFHSVVFAYSGTVSYERSYQARWETEITVECSPDVPKFTHISCVLTTNVDAPAVYQEEYYAHITACHRKFALYCPRDRVYKTMCFFLDDNKQSLQSLNSPILCDSPF